MKSLPKTGYDLIVGQTYFVNEGALIEINEQLDWKAAPDFLTCVKAKSDERFIVTFARKQGQEHFSPVAKLDEPETAETFYFFVGGKKVQVSFDVEKANKTTRELRALRANVHVERDTSAKPKVAKKKELAPEIAQLLKDLDL